MATKSRRCSVNLRNSVTRQLFESIDAQIQARPQNDPVRMQWLSMNKYSSQFVSSLPLGQHTIMSNAHLEVAYEIFYGTPCKAAEPYVGMIVKRQSRSGAVDDHLDAHGHALPKTASSSLTKPRHDSIKWCIDALMHEAEMPDECEVFNLFAAVVRSATSNIRGCKVYFSLQKLVLVYSNARMNGRCGAVSARQQSVTPEYVGIARRADRTHNGTRRNDVGPLEAEVKRHGRVDGLVLGACGEASSDVEQLVQKIAAGSAQRHWRGMDRRCHGSEVDPRCAGSKMAWCRSCPGAC